MHNATYLPKLHMNLYFVFIIEKEFAKALAAPVLFPDKGCQTSLLDNCSGTQVTVALKEHVVVMTK